MTKTPWFDSHSSLTTSAFEAAYRRLALPLMKFIVKRVGGNKEMAEEVFSRTVSAAWEGWNSFQHKCSYFTWVCRIALNKIADYYREEINRESKFVAPLLEEIAQASVTDLSPAERLALDELRASVRACLKLLPEDKKQLLFLRYWKDLTLKQIAKQLGVSERAVEGKLYRARKRLDEIISLEHPEIVPDYLRKDK